MNMDKETDELNITLKDKSETKKEPFKLTQLKLECFHWIYDEKEPGMPITTSIELECTYNYEKQKTEWTKKVIHKYVSFEDRHDCSVVSNFSVLKEDKIIKEIEKYNLRELKNNYFTEEEPECFRHWELRYNYYFKISGTFDQEIDEYEKISQLLEFNQIIKSKVRKVQEELHQFENQKLTEENHGII